MSVENFIKFLKEKGVISNDVEVEFIITKMNGDSKWDPFYNKVTGIKFTKLIDVVIPDGKIL